MNQKNASPFVPVAILQAPIKNTGILRLPYWESYAWDSRHGTSIH